MVVIAIITFVSLMFEKETKVGVIGGTILAPVVYIAHAAIPYLIFKNHLKRVFNKYYSKYTHNKALVCDARRQPASRPTA
jgi:hypothetical protein